MRCLVSLAAEFIDDAESVVIIKSNRLQTFIVVIHALLSLIPSVYLSFNFFAKIEFSRKLSTLPLSTSDDHVAQRMEIKLPLIIEIKAGSLNTGLLCKSFSF